jgi:hypothetical protein
MLRPPIAKCAESDGGLRLGQLASALRAPHPPRFSEVSAGVDPLGNTPDEFAALIKADTATWADAVAVTGLNTPQ